MDMEVSIDSDIYDDNMKVLDTDMFTSQIKVCIVCLSTTKIDKPVPQLSWLLTLGTVGLTWREATPGLCRVCYILVYRAERTLEQARKSQEILLELTNNGELTRESLNKYHKELTPLILLTTKHIGMNNFDYELSHEENESSHEENMFIEDEQECSIVKHEIFVVKQEPLPEWSDSYSDGNSDSNLPIECFKEKTKNVKKEKRKVDTKRKVTKESKVTKLPKVTKKTKTQIKKKRRLKTEADSEVKRKEAEADQQLKVFFDIAKLTTDQMKEELLQRKNSDNYNRSKWKCDLCFKGFISNATYESHLLGHSEAKGRIKCPICQLSFRSKVTAGQHLTCYHKYTFTCKMCPHVVKTRYKAIMHAAWHQGKRYSCNICNKVFENQPSLLCHKRIKHPSQDHVCNLCGYNFTNQKGLKYHRERKHALHDDSVPISGPRCEQCDITFLSAEALAAHTRVSPRHGECQRNDPGYRKVGASSQSAKPFPCEQCGKLMANKKIYSRHFAKLHPASTRTVFGEEDSPCLCPTCGMGFANSINLYNHSRVHSDERSFVCEICHKTFKKKEYLKIHMNRHTNEVRHPCHVCGKTFNNTSNRNRHLLVHASRDYKCNMCEKGFKSPWELDVHVKHVHLKEPYPKRNRRTTAKAKNYNINTDLYLDD